MSKRSRWKRGRDRFVYYVACGIALFVAVLPERISRGLGASVGWFLYVVLFGRRRIGRKNLALALPDLDERQRNKILVDCYKSLGRNILEVARLFSSRDDDVRDRVRYAEDGGASRRNYEDALALGRGVIFVSGHIGNWELLALGHSLHGHPLSVVVRTLDNPRLERRMQSLRSRGGNQILHRKSSVANIRELIRSLRKGEAVGFLVDQAVSRRHGVLVPFFGKLAWSHPAPARLSIKTGAAIVPAFIERDPENPRLHLIRCEPAIEFEPSGDAKNDELELTRLVQEAIERRIRYRPEDWFWVHRRWKRSPDEPEDY